MTDTKTILQESEEKMEEAVMYLEEALAHIRAGKANVKILDGIRVDSYGSMVPLNNVASINTPDARTIAIKPWDKSMFRVIEKAILDSEVGITPDIEVKIPEDADIAYLQTGDLADPQLKAAWEEAVRQAEAQ